MSNHCYPSPREHFTQNDTSNHYLESRHTEKEILVTQRYSSSRVRACRPTGSTLETLAVMNGILESPSSSHPLVVRLRSVLVSRGIDGSGFAELQRRLHVMDRDASRTLSSDEFKMAMQKCNAGFSDKELMSLFELFDVSNRGSYLDIDNFLCVLRGMVNNERRGLIRRAFEALDLRGDGLLDPEQVIERFDPTQHPEVRSGRKRAQEVFRSFLRTFEVGGEVENKITNAEFFGHHFNLSAAIEDDPYFAAVVCGCWHLEGRSRSSSPATSTDVLHGNTTPSSSAVRNPTSSSGGHFNGRIGSNNNSGGSSRRRFEDSKLLGDDSEGPHSFAHQLPHRPSFDYSDYRANKKTSPLRNIIMPEAHESDIDDNEEESVTSRMHSTHKSPKSRHY